MSVLETITTEAAFLAPLSFLKENGPNKLYISISKQQRYTSCPAGYSELDTGDNRSVFPFIMSILLGLILVCHSKVLNSSLCSLYYLLGVTWFFFIRISIHEGLNQSGDASTVCVHLWPQHLQFITWRLFAFYDPYTVYNKYLWGIVSAQKNVCLILSLWKYILKFILKLYHF